MQEQAASFVYRMALPATALVVLDARDASLEVGPRTRTKGVLYAVWWW